MGGGAWTGTDSTDSADATGATGSSPGTPGHNADPLAGAQAREQRGQFGRARQVERVAHETLVDVALPERAGHVAARSQRAHESHRRRCIEWIEGGGRAPPLDRSVGRRGVGQPDGRRVRPAGEDAALLVDPPGEFGRIGYVHAVEEGSAVEGEGARPVAGLQRGVEGECVAGDPAGREAERRTGRQRVAAERAAGRVERLVEQVARGRLIALGPEEGEGLVARQPDRPRAGEHGEQQELPPLHGRAPRRIVVVDDREAAKGEESPHAPGAARRLRTG